MSARSTFTADEKRFVAGLGGKVAAIFGVVYLAAGFWAASVQPEAVKAGLAETAFIRSTNLPVSPAMAGWRWSRLPFCSAHIAGFGKIAAGWLAWAAVLIAVLTEIMFTVYRDGVRDLTLLSKGYDVWNRVVVTNWSVVLLFLVLFVAGLGVIGWLVSVVARAKKDMEGAATL